MDASRRRRVVPAPVRPGAARPQLGAPGGLGRARGHPPLLVRPRRRRRPDRLGGAAGQGPRSGRGAARRRPGGASVHRPRRAARDLSTLARDRRCLRRAPDARRRSVAARRRALRALPASRRAAYGVQLRLPRASVGARSDAGVDSVGARRACPGRCSGDLGAVQPRRHPPGHAIRPRRHGVCVRDQARRGRPPTSRADAASPRGRAAGDGAARVDVHLPGRRARAAGGGGHPSRPAPGPDVAPIRRN